MSQRLLSKIIAQIMFLVNEILVESNCIWEYFDETIGSHQYHLEFHVAKSKPIILSESLCKKHNLIF